MNYEDARRFSYAFSATSREIIQNSPCKKGKGDCCEPSTTITREDAEIIAQAIRDGRISMSVAIEAIRNSYNTNRPRCAFLSKGRTCTIYEYRPAICALTGSGAAGTRSASDELTKLETAFLERGENTQVPFSKLGTTMCSGCHNELVRRGQTLSIEEIMNHTVLRNYLHEHGALYINQWVKNSLPNEVSK